MCVHSMILENLHSISTYAWQCPLQCECMHVCHTFQVLEAIGWSRVHTVVKNSGIRSTSLWNPKQTLRGSRPAWLKLTNHPEAPVRPRAAQHCTRKWLFKHTSCHVCDWVHVCVCLLAHVPAWDDMQVKCEYKIVHTHIMLTQTPSMCSVHEAKCSQIWWWPLLPIACHSKSSQHTQTLLWTSCIHHVNVTVM